MPGPEANEFLFFLVRASIKRDFDIMKLHSPGFLTCKHPDYGLRYLVSVSELLLWPMKYEE